MLTDADRATMQTLVNVAGETVPEEATLGAVIAFGVAIGLRMASDPRSVRWREFLTPPAPDVDQMLAEITEMLLSTRDVGRSN